MRQLSRLRHEHPVFFWGLLAIVLGFLLASLVIGLRVPGYRMEAATLHAAMTEQERAVRDRVLESRARRAELAIALMRREVRLKALEQNGLHLAISLEDSTLYLRHGPATLREIPVRIGRDTVISAPDGAVWRLVRPLGERYVVEKQTSPTYTIPAWVYVSRGEPLPREPERRLAGGLGRYVLRLNDGTEIYSEPSHGPFAGEVKPAGFMVPEREFRVIFDAIRRDAPVFIY